MQTDFYCTDYQVFVKNIKQKQIFLLQNVLKNKHFV